MDDLVLSGSARIVAGVLLVSIVAVEVGGAYVLRLMRGRGPATEFQQTFSRAGHAHAGVLVTLALVVLVYVDAAELPGWAEAVAARGVPAAAILMPAGFFFASAGSGRTEANRWIVLVWLGAGTLAVGVATTGVGLLVA